jgi:hypothetical protein
MSNIEFLKAVRDLSLAPTSSELELITLVLDPARKGEYSMKVLYDIVSSTSSTTGNGN